MVSYFRKKTASVANPVLPTIDTYLAYKGEEITAKDVSGFDLTGISFRKANCFNTVFRNANLSWVDFSHAFLTGADFSGANILEARFDFTTDIETANFGPVIYLPKWDNTPTNLTFWTSIWGGIVIKLGDTAWYGPGAFDRVRSSIVNNNLMVPSEVVINYFEAKWTLFNAAHNL